MNPCEVVAATGPGGPEIRVMPRDEPFASCAFAWPSDWTVHAPPWSPPPALATALLLELRQGDSCLSVYVARFGGEVDGFAYLSHWQEGTELRGWNGLPVALARQGADIHWAVVHTGPAVFFARATGAARALLDHATQSWRSLSGQGPAAEPLTPYTLGGVRTRRLGAWVERARVKSKHHGEKIGRLVALSPRGDLVAAVQMRAVDRRVYVGLNPAAIQARLDHDWHEMGFERDTLLVDPGPAGLADLSLGRLLGVPAELRRAFVRVGPTWLFVDGLWPREDLRARLNGRRHFDLLLALIER